MENVKILTQATDADAVYVLDRLRRIAELETQAKTHKETAEDCRRKRDEARAEAGKRLMEVRDRLMAEKKNSAISKHAPISGWWAWLRDNDLDTRTAHRLMTFAGDTPEQREARRKQDRERKRRDAEDSCPPYGWQAIAVELGAMDAVLSGGNMGKLRAWLQEQNPEKHWWHSRENESRLRECLARFIAEKKPEKASAKAQEYRADLSVSAQEKLNRAITLETARLKDQYLKDLYSEVEKRAPDIKARWAKETEEARQETARYARLCNGIAKKITEEEYKFLLNVLHPDRAPEDKKERFARAFNIVMKLKDYALA